MSVLLLGDIHLIWPNSIVTLNWKQVEKNGAFSSALLQQRCPLEYANSLLFNFHSMKRRIPSRKEGTYMIHDT